MKQLHRVMTADKKYAFTLEKEGFRLLFRWIHCVKKLAPSAAFRSWKHSSQPASFSLEMNYCF